MISHQLMMLTRLTDLAQWHICSAREIETTVFKHPHKQSLQVTTILMSQAILQQSMLVWHAEAAVVTKAAKQTTEIILCRRETDLVGIKNTNKPRNNHKPENTIILLVIKKKKNHPSLLEALLHNLCLEISVKTWHMRLDSIYSSFCVYHQNLCGHILPCVSLAHYSKVSQSGVDLIQIKPITFLIQTPRDDKHI